METVKEMDQDVTDESEEKSQSEEEDDICRDIPPMGLEVDRSPVYALLDASADDFLKDQDPGGLCYPSDWTEANVLQGQVQGWSRVTSLSCVFLPQRKREKTKSEEPAAHCPLCEDMRPPTSALSPDRAPDFGPENLRDGGVSSATSPGLVTEPGDPPTGSPPVDDAHQHRLLLRDKMAADTRVRDVVQPSPPPPLTSKPPALKSQRFDPGPPIHSFTVLPPVRTPQLRPQRAAQQVCFQESAAGGGSTGGVSEAGGTVPTADGAEEPGGADAFTDPELSEDAHQALAPPGAAYAQFQEKRHFLSTVTVPIAKRYGGPLGRITDTTHRANFSVGRHWKQAVRTGSEYSSRHERASPPQLPVLMGTKIPIVVSSQRPL